MRLALSLGPLHLELRADAPEPRRELAPRPRAVDGQHPMPERPIGHGSLTVATFMGSFNAMNEEDLNDVLAPVAIDAVAAGLGHERPWLVDAKGKPKRALKPYIDFIDPISILNYARTLSPPASGQAAALQPTMVHVYHLKAALDEVVLKHFGQLVDPVTRYIVTREYQAVMVRMAELIDPTGEIARMVAALPNDAPRG